MADSEPLIERLRSGVIPAVLTPLRADGSPCWPAFDRYAESVLSAPIAGLAVWGHTGRGLHLCERDRRSVLTRWRARTDRPIITGAGVPIGDAAAGSVSASLRATVEMAEVGADLGADAVLVYPPPALRTMPDRDMLLLELHERVAARSGLPVVAFHLHAEAGGYDYSTPFLDKLLKIPAVIGVKTATLDSAEACQRTLSSCLAARRLAITGEDRMFGPSLLWGANCALVGIAAAVPRLTVDVIDAWVGSDLDRLVRASRALDRLAEVTFRAPIEGYVARVMAAACWDGALSADGAHDPFGPPVPPGELAAVAATLDDIALARR